MPRRYLPEVRKPIGPVTRAAYVIRRAMRSVAELLGLVAEAVAVADEPSDRVIALM